MALLGWSATAFAFPAHRRLVKLVYQRDVNCTLCHADASGAQRTSYAKDWQKAHDRSKTSSGREAFETIEKLDSDGDGVDNGTELRAGSNPGDKASTPDAPGSAYLETARIPVPEEQIRLVFDALEGVAAAEPALSEQQIGAIEKDLERPLDEFERLPTLFYAVNGRKRTGVAAFGQFKVAGLRGFYSYLASFSTAGALQKVALFATGDDEGSTYMKFLRCVEAAGIDDKGIDAASRCEIAANRKIFRTAMLRSLQAMRATLLQIHAAGPLTRASAAGADGASSAAPTSSPSPNGAPKSRQSQPKELDLDAVPAAQTERVFDASTVYGVLAFMLAAYAFAVHRSVGWAARDTARPGFFQLESLPGAVRLLIGLAVIAFALVQILGAATAYAEVSVIHAGGAEYFRQVSWARLLGLSHAHVFGYTVMYGTLGFLTTGARASEKLKCTLIAASLWASLFDIAGWWAVKYVGGALTHFVTLMGLVLAVSALIMSGLVLKGIGASSPDSTERE